MKTGHMKARLGLLKGDALAAAVTAGVASDVAPPGDSSDAGEAVTGGDAVAAGIVAE